MRISASTPAVRPPVVRFSREDGGIELSPAAFRDSYVSTVSAKLGADPSHFKSAGLAQCYAVARELLGPVQAVALGGDALVALAGPEALDDLDAGMLKRLQAQPHGQTANGEAALLLAPDETTGYGSSTSRSVVMPRGFEPVLPHPVGAFIVGHELTHVRHQDVVAGFGRNYLCSKLGAAEQIAAAPILEQLNHDAELRADTEGLTYALAQGHTAPQLLVGVERFFGLTDGEASASHPARAERMENLRKSLEARPETSA